MPDYGFIAAPQVPSAMQSIGSVVNAAQGIQNLQQQRQQIGLTGIQLQRAQQANTERLAVQNFMSNPQNFQTDGKIDLAKVNAAIPQIAPLTGADVIGKLTTLANAQTTATQAKQNLTQAQRQIVAAPIGVLGRAGVQDPAMYSQAIDDVVKENPGNPDLAKLGQAYKTVLSMTAPGPHVAQVAVTASQSLLNPSEQQGALTPTVGLTNTGGQIVPTVTQPAVGGNPPSVQFSPTSLPTTVSPGQAQTPTTDVLGRPVIAVKSPTGQLSYQAPPGGAYKPLMTIPPGETTQTGQQLLQERATAQAAALQAPAQHFNNEQILHLAPSAFTGTGSPELAKVLNSVGIQDISGKAAKDTARLQHFLALQVENNAKAQGADTDQARALAAQAVLPTHSPAQAIQNITKINDAYVTGNQWYYKGMQAAINSPSNTEDIFALRKFQQEWAQNFDPNVMRLINAQQSGDKAQMAEITKELGTKGIKALLPKYLALKSLSSTGTLPAAQ